MGIDAGAKNNLVVGGLLVPSAHKSERGKLDERRTPDIRCTFEPARNAPTYARTASSHAARI